MPTPYSDMHDAVRSRFETAVETGLGLSVWYPNGARPATATDTLQVELQIEDDDTELHVPVQPCTYRKRGRWRAIVRSRLRIGDKAVLEAADAIRGAMTSGLVSGVQYITSWTEPMGREGNTWRVDTIGDIWADDQFTSQANVSPFVRPSREAAHNTIRSRFKSTVADAQSVQVIYDNDPTALSTSSATGVRLTIHTGRVVTIGQGTNAAMRVPGLATAQVFTRVGVGTDPALALADAIVLPFREVTDSGVAFGTPRLRFVGRGEQHWQTNVQIPFTFEEVR